MTMPAKDKKLGAADIAAILGRGNMIRDLARYFRARGMAGPARHLDQAFEEIERCWRDWER